MRRGKMRGRLSFWLGAGIELSLLGVAAAMAWGLSLPLWGGWRWDLRDLGMGLAGTVPMLMAFGALLKAQAAPFRRIREFFEVAVRPALGGWSVGQLAVISLLAGVCEEAWFRSVVQGGIREWLGAVPALILASLFFGICHWITPAYLALAVLMGIYLGGLWWWSGNLLVPAVTHAVYDFAALMWLLRFPRTMPEASEGLGPHAKGDGD